MGAAIGLSPRSRPGGAPEAQTYRAVPSPAPIMIGREAELAQLRGWFAKACEGARQVVFVSGEPGIGKDHARAGVPRFARARCVTTSRM
jgi:hypothetical protein